MPLIKESEQKEPKTSQPLSKSLKVMGAALALIVIFTPIALALLELSPLAIAVGTFLIAALCVGVFTGAATDEQNLGLERQKFKMPSASAAQASTLKTTPSINPKSINEITTDSTAGTANLPKKRGGPS